MLNHATNRTQTRRELQFEEMNTQEKISNENGNWYITEIVEKCESVERNKEKDLRRVTTQGNHHLIKASSPEKAYDKAVKIGKEGEYKFTNTDKIEMEWIFVGIGELLPIYDDNIEDGAEIMWKDYGFISDRRTKRFIFDKKELLNNIRPKPNYKKQQFTNFREIRIRNRQNTLYWTSDLFPGMTTLEKKDTYSSKEDANFLNNMVTREYK